MTERTTVVFMCLVYITFAQLPPIWQTSPYIEAKDIIVVAGDQKTFGTYTLTVNFEATFVTPIIILAIPQLRIKTDEDLNYKSYHSLLTTTNFIHTLQIPSSKTSVWYMRIRYMVINTGILTTEFVAAYKEHSAVGTSINGPAGTSRTSTFTTTLTPTLPMIGTPKCLSFLAGVNCPNVTQYQLNLTCQVTNSNTATITAKVHTATLVTTFSYYVLVWDVAQLKLKSFFFVDQAITSTYYNAQRSYISTPQGFFDKNYIAGLQSFSISNNVEYNISVSNFLLFNSPSTIYNDMSQFQVRVRNCSQSVRPYFNKADSLCYPLCPQYTFPIAAAFACDPCPSGCRTCSSSTVCTLCATGFSLTSGLCVCSNYTYAFNNICYGCHYSCQTCISGQYYACLTCDSNMYRLAVNANTTFGYSSSQFMFLCNCMPDFVDALTLKCIQKCGDGKAVIDACDDGNTNSFDGCSSTCQIQANFTCQKDVNSLSSCYYYGYISMTIVKLIKEDFSNVLNVYIQITPWIPTMAALSSPATIFTNTSVGTVSCSTYLDRYLVYTFEYLVQIQLILVNFEIRPTASGIFSRLHPANVTAVMETNNAYTLLLYSQQDYQEASAFRYFCRVSGLLMLASGLLYIFGRLKWVGNLLFFTLQFQYMSMLVVPQFSPLLSSLSEIKAIMGYNQVLGSQDFDIPRYEAFWVLYFNKDYLMNVNIMVVLPCFALMMYAVYKIAYNYNKAQCIQFGGDPDKSFRSKKIYRILSFFDWEFFMFWNFFNMAEQIVAMILFSEKPYMGYLPLILFNIVCITLSIVPMFFRRAEVRSYTQLLYRRDSGKEESIFSLLSILVMYVLLAFSVIASMIVYYFIFLVPVVMIIYIIKNDSFASKWIKAAYIINCCCILMTLMYNLLMTKLVNEVHYLPFGYLIIFYFDWIFNLIVWAREAVILCKFGGQRDMAEILRNTNSSNVGIEDEFDFFKSPSPIKKGIKGNEKDNNQNSSLLKNIIKDNHSKINNSTQRKPLNMTYNRYEYESNSSRARQQQQEKEVQQANNERQNLRRNRAKWQQEMKEMKDIKQIRERNRSELRRNPDNNVKKSLIRTTGQKGIDRSVIEDLNNKTIRYM